MEKQNEEKETLLRKQLYKVFVLLTHSWEQSKMFPFSIVVDFVVSLVNLTIYNLFDCEYIQKMGSSLNNILFKKS